jgi:transcriptional/translational regulatory protein YebC/TACO1
MFEQKGIVTLVGSVSEEQLLEASLEGGAESYELNQEDDEEIAEVFTEVSNLEALNQTLKEKGLPVREAELRWIPSNSVEVTDPDLARSLLKLMDALEDLDDVQNVTANFEMAEQLMSLSLV